MLHKHALGANDGVAIFTEVLDLLVWVLEAEDLPESAALRCLVFRGLDLAHWLLAARVEVLLRISERPV